MIVNIIAVVGANRREISLFHLFRMYLFVLSDHAIILYEHHTLMNVFIIANYMWFLVPSKFGYVIQEYVLEA